MKDILQVFQVIFAGALGALAAYFNVLLIPLGVLVAVMLLDYLTGMASAAKSKNSAAAWACSVFSKKPGIWRWSPSAWWWMLAI